MKTLGIGIIGCGKIAQVRHIPEYAENPRTEIVGYYDCNRERAEQLAARYGGEVFSSPEELLACSLIDAVSICTTNSTHASLSIAALRAGKHVLCEKPMAVTLEECELMAQESRDAKRHLLVAHNQRLWTLHKKAKQLLDCGAIGKPISFKTSFEHSGPDFWSVDRGSKTWFFDKNKSAFGAMADLGIHKLDLMRFLLDSDIKEVLAMMGTLDKKNPSGAPIAIEDNALALYRMENGVMGTVSASWTCYGKENNDTTIYGTEGCLKIRADKNTVTVIKSNEETATYHLPAQNNSGIIDAFAETILDGTPTLSDAETILPSMKALFATFEAADSGKRINL